MSPTKLKHRLTSNVKLLHKVALVYKNKALILKRTESSSSRPGKWDLPGGNSEWPENLRSEKLNPHQADVSREIKEETGFEVKQDQFHLDNLIYFATYYEPEKELYSVNCGWLVSLDEFVDADDQDLSSLITLSFEHTDYRWITLDQLDQFDFGGPQRDYETAVIRRALS